MFSLLTKYHFHQQGTGGGQSSSALLWPTLPLPYMYTGPSYVNFDMWVSISPIFTMGFIRP